MDTPVMKNRFKTILFCSILAVCTSSCIVRSPKYASAEQVFALKIGMTQTEVFTDLGIVPYALELKSDSGTTYIYEYRTTQRRTIPLFTRRTNGTRAKGPFMDLSITYDNTGKVTRLRSKPAPKEEKSQFTVDVNSIFTLLTVTAPALLVYLGLQNK